MDIRGVLVLVIERLCYSCQLCEAEALHKYVNEPSNEI